MSLLLKTRGTKTAEFVFFLASVVRMPPFEREACVDSCSHKRILYCL